MGYIIVDSSVSRAHTEAEQKFLISDFQALDRTSGSYWIASSIWATLDANRSLESGRPKSESCSPLERDVIAYERRSSNYPVRYSDKTCLLKKETRNFFQLTNR